MKKYYFLVILFLIFLNTACSTSDDDTTAATEDTGSVSNDIQPILESQGIELVNTCSFHDKTTGKDYTGYLGIFKGKSQNGIFHKFCDENGENCDESKMITNAPKYCLVLTGTSYAMGYQAGYLRPLSVKKMADVYIKEALFDQFGLLGIKREDIQKLGEDKLFAWFYDNVKEMIFEEYNESKDYSKIKNESRIPTYLFDEMQGITDGANTALKEIGDDYRVKFDDIYAISEGVDGLFCFVGKFLFGNGIDKEMIGEASELISIIGKELVLGERNGKLEYFPKRESFPFLKFGCNGFMVTGDATKDGKTYMGRDFMFTTGGVINDESCIMIYLPEKQNGYPFVTVGPTGFVGQCVGVNSQGLSVGIDISISGAFSKDVGVGGLIILRDLLQRTSNIEEAVNRFRKFERGMPWDFFIADDEDSRYGHGVVLEVGRNDLDDDGESVGPFTGPDAIKIINPLELLSIKSALKLTGTEDLNPDGTINAGTMVRGAKWKYPDVDKFLDKDRGRGTENDACGFLDLEKYKSYYSSGYKYHETGESDDEMLIVTNHFNIPRMRVSQFHPVSNYGYNLGMMGDSTWRYEYMLSLINENYGKISFFGEGDFPEPGTAGWIIDFLNPNFDHPVKGNIPNGVKKYYKPQNRDVDGMHIVINNTDREFKSLFNYLPDPWAGIKLMPFVNWWNSRNQNN